MLLSSEISTYGILSQCWSIFPTNLLYMLAYLDLIEVNLNSSTLKQKWNLLKAFLEQQQLIPATSLIVATFIKRAVQKCIHACKLAENHYSAHVSPSFKNHLVCLMKTAVCMEAVHSSNQCSGNKLISLVFKLFFSSLINGKLQIFLMC